MPFELDTPAAYRSIEEADYPNLFQNGDELPPIDQLSDGQKKFLHIEEAQIGVSLAENPERFLALHNERALIFQARAGALYEEIAPAFSETLSDHLTSIAPEQSDWPAIINNRLGRIRHVHVMDFLLTQRWAQFDSIINVLEFSNAWSLLDPTPAAEGRIGYAAAVPLLRSLIEVTPRLEQMLERGLFLPTPLGPIFGEVEKILGPTGIETIAAMREQLPNPTDINATREHTLRKIAKLSLPSQTQPALTSALRRHMGAHQAAGTHLNTLIEQALAA